MRRSLLILLGVGAVAALVVLVVPRLTRQPESRIALLPEQPVPQINILTPAFGEEVELGSGVSVDAFAFHPQPVTAIELWIDGQLLGIQEADGEGLTPFSASFVWTPQSLGVHTLMARALGTEGPLGFSPSVNVSVVEPVLSGELDEFEGVPNDPDDTTMPTVLPVYDDIAPVSAPPGLADVPPAVPQDGPPEPAEADASPTAPELLIAVKECTANLLIHDLSEDELGFILYRQGSLEQTWQQVADLAANQGQGWMKFSDAPGPGGFNYFVAAYNSQGDSPSNPVLVNFSPGCPSDDGDGDFPPILQLDLGELLADSSADRAYCYQTMDGTNWSRFPIEGFFMPGGEDETSLISPDGLIGQGVETLELTLECWGWMGGELELLGNYQHTFDLDLQPEEGLTFQGSPLANVAQLGDRVGPTFYPLGGSIGEDFISEIDHDMLQNLLVHDPAMPTLITYVTYDPEVCQSHLMPEAQSVLGSLLFCTPYPGYNSGQTGDNPQPYLVWDFGWACGAGAGDPPCHSYDYYESLAADIGGNVWFTITDQSNAGTFYWTVDAPYLRKFTVPTVACSGQRSFSVTMYFDDGEQWHYSLPSNVYAIDCPAPIPPHVPMDITFETITLGNLDDGEGDPVDVELYGYIRLLVPGNEDYYLNLAEWDEQAGHCPDESYSWGQLPRGGLLVTDGCTKTFGNGTHDLSGVALCQGYSKENCSISGWSVQNNTVRLTLSDDQTLIMYLAAYDWDDASGNDMQCWSLIKFPARSRFEWAQIQNQEFTFFDWGSDHGSCTVSGVINAVLP